MKKRKKKNDLIFISIIIIVSVITALACGLKSYSDDKKNKEAVSKFKQEEQQKQAENEGNKNITTSIKYDKKVIGSKYIAVGDSITWGHLSGNGTESSPFVRAEYPYPTIVANTLGLDLTYGAQTGSGWLQLSGNKTAVTIVDNTDFSGYDLVTLAFGTNDYAGNQPLGTIKDNYETTKTVYSAMKHCLDKIIADNQSVTIILITPINSCTHGTEETNWRYGTKNTAGYTLSDLCDVIVDVANNYKLPYIDNRDGSPVNNNNIDKGIFVDKLHPTNDFYRVLGNYYAEQIGKYVVVNKKTDTQ